MCIRPRARGPALLRPRSRPTAMPSAPARVGLHSLPIPRSRMQAKHGSPGRATPLASGGQANRTPGASSDHPAAAPPDTRSRMRPTGSAAALTHPAAAAMRGAASARNACYYGLRPFRLCDRRGDNGQTASNEDLAKQSQPAAHAVCRVGVSCRGNREAACRAHWPGQD